jgi:hypothetical protein
MHRFGQEYTSVQPLPQAQSSCSGQVRRHSRWKRNTIAGLWSRGRAASQRFQPLAVMPNLLQAGSVATSTARFNALGRSRHRIHSAARLRNDPQRVIEIAN